MGWIEILKCPITGEDIRLLSDMDIVLLNRRIEENNVWQVDGKQMKDAIEVCLINASGNYYYPIVDDIVLLLPDLALVDNRERILGDTLSDDKKLVKNFYDDRGWHTTSKGDYEDADIFEDLRPFAQEYIKKCHDRVSRYLLPSGTYMVDAASGALQFEDYLQYSANYTYRICVDLSFTGLRECKKKLGDKAICLLCDMTNLPIKDNKVDGFVSLNTIYHIPKDEQLKAITELYRILIQGGKGVVVYDWYKHSPWMNLSLLPFRGVQYIGNKIKKAASKISGKAAPAKMLYFHAHPYEYFKKHLPVPFELKVWRSVSVPFMKTYLHENMNGKKWLQKIYEKEERQPELCGLKGEYPLFAFNKK
ncbi:MAG: class I SAM-dependent methyltransferase [Ferruginibacter sp.]|nr:class I SAM-dependent methyltransferase [Ferruginibacter sp.]